MTRLEHSAYSTITLMRCRGPQPPCDMTRPIAAIRSRSALSDIVEDGDCNTPATVTGRCHRSDQTTRVGNTVPCHQSVLPARVTSRCHLPVSSVGVTGPCHQSVSPAPVTSRCYRPVSPVGVTSRCYRPVSQVSSRCPRLVSPVGVTGPCHQSVSPAGVTGTFHQLMLPARVTSRCYRRVSPVRVTRQPATCPHRLLATTPHSFRVDRQTALNIDISALVTRWRSSIISYNLTGFNRIAIHFPCVGLWMAPGQRSLRLI